MIVISYIFSTSGKAQSLHFNTLIFLLVIAHRTCLFVHVHFIHLSIEKSVKIEIMIKKSEQNGKTTKKTKIYKRIITEISIGIIVVVTSKTIKIKRISANDNLNEINVNCVYKHIRIDPKSLAPEYGKSVHDY